MARISVIVVIGYGAIVALAYLFQRSMLYFPGGALPSPARAGLAEMATMALTTEDGLSLVAWYKAPADGGAVIVLFHGNAGTIADRAFKARPLLDAGFGLLLVEYRGYGGNPGSPSETGLYADGHAALKFLDGQGIGADRIVLYGESLGCGVAVELATTQPFAALVLEAPFTSVPDVGASHYPYLPVRWLAKDRFASIDKIGRIEAPLLLIHGERDNVVPIRFGRRLFAAAPEPKSALFVPAAGHNDLYDHGVAASVIEFLTETTR